MSKNVLAWFRLGIFKKMLITMLFVSMVPLGAIWYVGYEDSITRISNNINQQLGNISERLVGHVNDWILMNLKALRQNAALSDIASMEAQKQKPILQTILKEYEWSYLVFTIGTDGINVGRSDNKKTKDYSKRTYVKDVVAGKSVGKQIVIGKTSGKPALILAVPIYGKEESINYKYLAGVMAIGMNLIDMSSRITNLRVGKTGFAFLMDEKGKVVSHQKEEIANTLADFSQHPAFINAPAKDKKLVTYTEEGKQIVAVVQRTEQGWIMVTQQDYDEAYRPIREANKKALILLGITFLIVILITYIFSKRLTNPIRNLTRIADEMSRGRVIERIREVKRRDELGSLAAAIDRMGASIRLAMDRLKAKP